MDERIEKVKNDIETFLKDSVDHQNKHIDYILVDPDTNETYVLASDGYDEAIEFTPLSKNYEGGYTNVPEWDYNFDYYIYNLLDEGKQIAFMTDDVHYGIWNSINELYPEDIDYKEGVQWYLQYCADKGITKEYLDEKTGKDTPDIMKHFEGLAMFETMEYKGYIIEADDANLDNPKENLVNIYENKQDFENKECIETVSLNTVGLKQNIREYIDEFYVDKSVIENEKAYFTFVLGYDLLNDMLSKSSTPENDISYDFCSMVAGEFLKSEEYKNEKHSAYEMLEKWVNDNNDYIKSEYSKFTGIDFKVDDISIIKTDDTHYYRLDWDCPTEDYKAVYLAVKGEISMNPSLNLFSTSGVGYDWRVSRNHTFTTISEEMFKENATLKNIVYFFDKDGQYNDLLNYPDDYQKQIDICLLEDGYNPHNKVSLKDQLKIMKNKRKMNEIGKQLEKDTKEER